jgi:hypothetical protein
MLPDLSDFPQNARCVSPMKTADGHPVELFSSLNPATEEQHFAWMQQYRLDGVALQRFATWLKPPLLQNVNRVLENVRHAAEHHGRVFFVMYDLSGMTPANILTVAKDWEQLERDGLTPAPPIFIIADIRCSRYGDWASRAGHSRQKTRARCLTRLPRRAHLTAS